MNAEAREVLRAAALEGVPQITGRYNDYRGGLCAVGVLIHGGVRMAELQTRVAGCHICGEQYTKRGNPILTEEFLLVHLNDDHRLDFLAIAEKMPQDDVSEQSHN